MHSSFDVKLGHKKRRIKGEESGNREASGKCGYRCEGETVWKEWDGENKMHEINLSLWEDVIKVERKWLGEDRDEWR